MRKGARLEPRRLFIEQRHEEVSDAEQDYHSDQGSGPLGPPGWLVEGDMSTPKELTKVEELHEFLQGRAPKGYRIGADEMPQLDAETAWTVVWYISNQYHQYRDTIARCEVCGLIYDSERGGSCLDYGKAPSHFCDDCTYSEEFEAKKLTDPDRQVACDAVVL